MLKCGLLGILISSVRATTTLLFNGNGATEGGWTDDNNIASDRRFSGAPYDDFQVTDPQWQITSVYCNLYADSIPSKPIIDGAICTIRSEV